ncbi:hypothetical protein QTG54_013163 [Skeletonema marinoi]|uniref:Uncharacterized protein n=1 Tax=Skeletonema marinoi TaxID=267567 RepID=A0AAD8XYX3_9STRA|nr:hypothetical protein QTG54_013163 [Skeletonema marinoi]
MGASGKKVKGRYSFVYVYEDGEWKINHHHSSIMPEGIVTAEPITKEEVRSSSAFGTMLLLPKTPRRLLLDTARRVFSSPLCLMFPVMITSERLTTSQTSSNWSPKERSSTETSSLEPTGPRMPVSTNSQWVPLDRRLRDVTPTFMSSRMANGRSLNTTPVSCLRQESPSQSPRRRSRTFSNFGTPLLPLRTPMPLPSVMLPRQSFSPLSLMFPVPTTV